MKTERKLLLQILSNKIDVDSVPNASLMEEIA